MPNIVAIIQARVGSSRLPNKVFADILGKPMLQRVYERVKKAKLLDDVVVATSTAEEDMAIVQWGRRNGIPVYRGGKTVKDVLGRYWDVAQQVKADVVVRITADCPMHDAAVIDWCIQESRDSSFLSNVIVPPTFPDGLDCEVFTVDLLRRAHEAANCPLEREHVTPWMLAAEGRNIVTVGHTPDLSHHRWTVDEPADLEFVRAVYSELGEDFGMDNVVTLLECKPELVLINAHIARNEGYKKSLEEEKQCR